ncbi:MAG: hypothetical protein ACFFG0_45550 [Candidatus Thorarchaeota archaeon]
MKIKKNSCIEFGLFLTIIGTILFISLLPIMFIVMIIFPLDWNTFEKITIFVAKFSLVFVSSGFIIVMLKQGIKSQNVI